MTPTIVLLICLLGAVATFFAGLLGMGGGVLIVPGLAAIFHAHDFAYSILMQLALGTSLATVFFTSVFAMRAHQKRIKIKWEIVARLVPGLLIGSIFGAWTVSIFKTTWLMIIFGTLLAYIGLKFVLTDPSREKIKMLHKNTLLYLGLIIGLLAAMMGLGGGVFIVPLLKRYIAEMREVIALSAVCLIPVSFVAASAYMVLGWNTPALPTHSLGFVYWPAVIPLVIMSAIFTPIGVKLAHTLPQQTVKRVFGIFICCISTMMFYAAFQG